MSEQWTKRIRNTNKLVRAIARYVLTKPGFNADKLYGLCKLTWVTGSYDSEASAYIRSTKIPALGDVFVRDFSNKSLGYVAKEISELMQSEQVEELILQHTGFTNLYNAYRNTGRTWVHSNFTLLQKIFHSAYELQTDEEGLNIILDIESLSGIPNAGDEEKVMPPEYFLTPALAALDQRLRFPLINGKPGVQKLLKILNVKGSPLSLQYARMIDLYGIGGIEDSADLDQVEDWSDFIPVNGKAPTKQLLALKPTEGHDLPLKDEDDIASLQKEREVVQKRIHNVITNKLIKILTNYTLHEGRKKSAMFDAMVKNYNRKGDDLLIEVKSLTEDAHVRMAIGQLFAYSYELNSARTLHLAVLLPNEPSESLKGLLESLDIGTLWLEGDRLYTSNDWLSLLCDA